MMSGSQPYPRICAKCKNHGLYSILKGHKHLCIYRECLCPSCRVLVNKRQKRVPQLTQMVKSVTEKNQDESKKNQDSFDYKEKMLGIPLQTEYNDKAYKDEMKIEHLYFIEDKESMPYYPNRDVQCQSSCFQTPGYGKCQFCWCRKQDLLCNTIDFPVSNRGYNNTRFTTLNDPTAVFNRGYNNTHFTTLNNPTAVFNNHAYNTLQSTMVNYPMMHTVNNDVKPQSNSSNYPTTNLINKACLDITGYQTTSHYGVHMATDDSRQVALLYLPQRALGKFHFPSVRTEEKRKQTITYPNGRGHRKPPYCIVLTFVLDAKAGYSQEQVEHVLGIKEHCCPKTAIEFTPRHIQRVLNQILVPAEYGTDLQIEILV